MAFKVVATPVWRAHRRRRIRTRARRYGRWASPSRRPEAGTPEEYLESIRDADAVIAGGAWLERGRSSAGSTAAR